MWRAHIKPGKQYALREKRGAVFQRVRILEHVRRNKWKAEWIDPNPGLVDFIESRHLICPWGELKAFLREEEAERRLREHNEARGYQYASPVDDALQTVFESVGDDVSYDRGTLWGSPEAIGRLKARAKVEGTDSPMAYIDRGGTLHVPFDQAVELARRFSAAEPAAVLLDIESTERKWSQQARTPGEDYIVGLLNKYRAAYALIRQWAGHDAAVAQREAEIQKLERLVWDAIYALQKAGDDREAERLRRAIGRIG